MPEQPLAPLKTVADAQLMWTIAQCDYSALSAGTKTELPMKYIPMRKGGVDNAGPRACGLLLTTSSSKGSIDRQIGV